MFLKIRKANKNDLLIYYNWANDSTVRQNAISTASIPLDSHRNWFQHRLENPLTFMYLLSVNEVSLGQIRFDVKKHHAFIDYSIGKPFRGKGYGKKMMQKGMDKFLEDASLLNIEKIIGIVKEDNYPSINVFERLDFYFERKEEIKNNTYKVFSFCIKN